MIRPQLKVSHFLPIVLTVLFLSPSTTRASEEEKGFQFAFENDPSIPIVNISVAFRKGASSDPADLPGLTSFMGEMLLKGTKLRNKSQLELRMDELGSGIGIDVRSEFFAVRGSVLSRNLRPFLDLLSEVILQPSFAEREIVRHRTRLTSELIAMRSNDSAVLRYHFNRFLFAGHPYGYPSSGTLASLKKITRDKLMKQHLVLLARDQMVIAGTGDADSKVLLEWGRNLERNLPRGSAPLRIPPPKVFPRSRVLIVDKPDRTQSPVVVSQIGISFNDPSFFPLYVANYAFGGPTFSSRLLQEIRVKRGWSYGAGSHFQYGSTAREWNYSFSPATKDVGPAIKFSLEMLKSLRDNGISAEELAFSKESIVNGAGFLYNTPARRIENTLIEKMFSLPDGFFKSYADKIATTTLEQVNESLQGFLAPDSRAIGVVGSEKDLKHILSEATGVPEKYIVVKPFTAD